MNTNIPGLSSEDIERFKLLSLRSDKFLDFVSKETKLALAKFIGNSKEIQQVKTMVAKLSMVQDSFLIQGETGTGKELLAKASHGDRKGQFVPVNCAAITESLAEAAFFGTEKGSYTGSAKDTPGYIRTARNGTLFLDEIGDLPLSLQAKLLRFCQDGNIMSVGSATLEHVETRIVCATHKPLSGSTTFRKDLYYRLARFTVSIPPLRARVDDIPLLFQHFLGENNYPLDLHSQLSEDISGNVREIEAIARSYQLFGKDVCGNNFGTARWAGGQV